MTQNEDRVICAGCGEIIQFRGNNDWTFTSEKTPLHYGGLWGLKCWNAHQVSRENSGRRAPDPIAAAKHEFGGDLVELPDGYYLCGRLINLIPLMQAMNTRRLARGEAQLSTNPAWVVEG